MGRNEVDILIRILVILLSLGIVALAFCLYFPFVGTLMRFWAHYNPKQIVLGDESRGEMGILQLGLTDDSQNFNGYWGLMRRVKRIEGIRGLWKGLDVFAVYFFGNFMILIILFTILRFIFSLHLGLASASLSIVPIVIAYLSAIPLRAVFIRSFAASRRLRISQPAQMYKTLLYNTFERKYPLSLLSIPGLLIGFFLNDLEVYSLSKLRESIMQLMRLQRPLSRESICLSLILDLCGALLLTPMEVIITRLALQERRRTVHHVASEDDPTGPAPVSTVSGEPNPPSYDDLEGIEFAGFEEDVINLRTDQEPYTGFMNCVQCIAKEEGFSTFWRGWYILAGVIFLNDILQKVALISGANPFWW